MNYNLANKIAKVCDGRVIEVYKDYSVLILNLDSLITNLIRNAFEFTNDNEITAINEEVRPIQIIQNLDGNYILS